MLLPTAWKCLQVFLVQFFLFDNEPVASFWSDSAQFLNAKHKEIDWYVEGCIVDVDQITSRL